MSTGKDYVSISLAAPEFGNRTLCAKFGRAAVSSDENDFAIVRNPRQRGETEKPSARKAEGSPFFPKQAGIDPAPCRTRP